MAKRGNQKLSEKILELREQKNLSQAQLAASAEIDASLLSRLIRGDRDWRPEHIVALARVFEVSALELVAGTDATSVLSDWVSQIDFDKAERARLLAEQEVGVLRAHVAAQNARLVPLEPLAREAQGLRSQLETMKMMANAALHDREGAVLELDALRRSWETMRAENVALRQSLSQAGRQLLAVQQEAARTRAGAGMVTGLSLLGAALLMGRGK